MIITNAFSLQMLDLNKEQQISIKPITISGVIDMHVAKGLVKGAGIDSAVGHADTAAVLTSLLGFNVPVNRVNIELGEEPIIVAQLVGGRLPEGTTTLPDGFEFKFLLVHKINSTSDASNTDNTSLFNNSGTLGVLHEMINPT